MTTPQRFAWTIVAAALASACNRADPDAEARRAAAKMKTVASRAGDQLADSWITTKIQAQYFADEDIKARYLNVSTRDGIVTLSGRIENDAARQQALEIARNTDGVRRVDDRLQIGGPVRAEDRTFEQPAPTEPRAPEPSSSGAVATSGTIDDAQITTTIQSKFFLDDVIKGRRINVASSQGIVRLAGQVESEKERAQALLLARTTDGVQRVEDHLSVAASGIAASGIVVEQMNDEMLATRIEEQLVGRGQPGAGAIEVTAKDGVILLQGDVPNQAAREQALDLARNTEGVVQVVDRLKVVGGRR